MSYTIDYFIKKFEAIPEEKWCTNHFENIHGQRCALGHCEETDSILIPDEARSLRGIFETKGMYVSEVNDGDIDVYPQPTPKQRILAALYDFKKLQS